MAQGKFYVYALIDPLDNSPFYIGKGSGDRAYEHEKEARRGGCTPKCKKILEILCAGREIKVEIVRRFHKEDAAYAHEERLIKKIGIENLTNLAPGGRNPYAHKTDEQREWDATIVRLHSKISKVRERNLIPCMRFAGELFEIKQELLDKADGWFAQVSQRRNASWIAKHSRV